MLLSFRGLLGTGALCAFLITTPMVRAEAIPAVPPNAPVLAEHMMRHSSQLSLELSLVFWANFPIAPQVAAQMTARNPYLAGLIATQLSFIPVRPSNPTGRPIPRPPEFMVAWRMQDYFIQVGELYQALWLLSQEAGRPGPGAAAAHARYVQQLQGTINRFSIALPATYFYIEALRRTYLVAPVLDCPNRDMLVERLVRIERMVFELRRVMDTLFASSFFGPHFPGSWGMVEATFGSFRIDVMGPGPVEIAPFPFFQEGPRGGGQFYTPNHVTPVARPQGGGPILEYDSREWEGNWNNLGQGYEQGNPIDPQAGPVPGTDFGAQGQQPGANPNNGQYGPAFEGQGAGFGGQQAPSQPGQQPGVYGPGYGQQLPQQGYYDPRQQQGYDPRQQQGFDPRQQQQQGFDPRQQQQQGFDPRQQQQGYDPRRLQQPGYGRQQQALPGQQVPQQQPGYNPGQQQPNQNRQGSGQALPWGNFDYNQSN